MDEGLTTKNGGDNEAELESHNQMQNVLRGVTFFELGEKTTHPKSLGRQLKFP